MKDWQSEAVTSHLIVKKAFGLRMQSVVFHQCSLVRNSLACLLTSICVSLRIIIRCVYFTVWIQCSMSKWQWKVCRHRLGLSSVVPAGQGIPVGVVDNWNAAVIPIHSSPTGLHIIESEVRDLNMWVYMLTLKKTSLWTLAFSISLTVNW